MNFNRLLTQEIPGHSHDNWGVADDHYSVCDDLKDSVEIFHNVSVTPWWTIRADLQIIDPGLSTSDTAVFADLCTVSRQ